MIKKYLILSSILMATVSLQAETKVLVTTVGAYVKPGASVDMSYKNQRVAIDEVADLNVTFTTTVTLGTLTLEVKLDDALKEAEKIESQYLFTLDSNQTKHQLNLKVSSAKDGRHYIRVLAKVDSGEGVRMRSFSIPISVGSGQVKFSKQKALLQNGKGENISVAKAEETVIQK